MNQKQKPALFIDRDGTINYDTGYISEAKNLRLLFGVKQALWRFKKAGFFIFVVSNQSGIGRGFFSIHNLHLIEQRLNQKLGPSRPDAYFYCQHRPDQQCTCRKPKSGLLEQAFQQWPVDRKRSLIVGDKLSDVETGDNFSIPGFLVLSGEGQKQLAIGSTKGIRINVVPNLMVLADLILCKK